MISEYYIVEANNLAFSRLAQKGRGDGRNAYLHSVAVARYLQDRLEIQDSETIAIALLHDIIEDGEIGVDRLKAHFGDSVAKGVFELSRDDSYRGKDIIDKLHTKMLQNLKIQKASKAARLVKCADRIDNLSTALSLPKHSTKYNAIPMWAIETRYSLLELARVTNHKLYRDMLALVVEIEDQKREEIESLISQYISRYGNKIVTLLP